MIELGYDCGEYGADGEFGNDTLSAVRVFHTAMGLTVDGIVGSKTYAERSKTLDALATETDVDEPAEDAMPTGDLTVAAGTWNLRTGPGAEYR